MAVTTTKAAVQRTTDGLLLPNIGRLEYVHPDMLVVDEYNVREEEVVPSPGLIASVREKGVEDALIGRPLPDGKIGVLAGQLRMLSAQAVTAELVEAGRKRDVRAVPVMVRDDLADADNDTIAEALALSLAENQLRQQMTTADVVKATQQIALLPLSKTKKRRIARAAGLTDADLAAAPKVAAMGKEVRDEAVSYDFDFQQLADLAEVEDVPGAADALAEAREEDRRGRTKDHGNWKHTLASLQAEKQTIAEAAVLRARLTGEGYTEVPNYWYYLQPGDKHRKVAELRDDQGEHLDQEQHNAQCPGRAFILDDSRSEVKVIWACADWREHGHRIPGNGPAAEGKAAKQGPSPAEVGKKNKAEEAARQVRKEFVKALVAAKLSDAAVTLTLRVMTDMPWWYHHAVGADARDDLAFLLSEAAPKESASSRNVFAKVVARFRKARRELNIPFAQVAVAYEKQMGGKKHWSRPGQDTADWLRFLVAEGYTLSAIEKEMLAAVEEKERQEAERKAEWEAREAERKAAREAQVDTEAEDAEPGGDEGPVAAEPDARPEAVSAEEAQVESGDAVVQPEDVGDQAAESSAA
ncbi:ParB N-terminal domain-containing protein [Kitasatospora sp. NPDC093679]|uniref:ParB/RepB/Spo0J family partition protein n=1 Tax=Kitasatospora sp. NPDC093679 TaxID=3154983 RepID=UPI003440E481